MKRIEAFGLVEVELTRTESLPNSTVLSVITSLNSEESVIFRNFENKRIVV